MLNSKLKLEPNAVWIMYSCEGSDPYFEKFVTKKTVVPSAVVLGSRETLFVHELDQENVSDFCGEVVVYNENFPMIKNILNLLQKMDYPTKIYLNFSDKLDSQTDVLGHGTFRFLSDNITEFYRENKRATPQFASADELLYFLLDTKTEDDIKYLKVAARRALEILSAAFKKIKTGMTEMQIANLVHSIFKIKPKYFRYYGIVNEEFSWEKSSCPIVLVGSNLKKGGHTIPSEKILTPGDTIYFDFGVKITLNNGKSYSSDLQRMGYALNRGEKNPPEEVQYVFKTLVNAINLGAMNMKPNIPGYEIDEIVRNQILNNGFPDYNHSTGHPIGENAHNPGPGISPKGYKRSALLLQENGVYTIEPRVQIENGGSIEEMVRVTKTGGEFLCPPQKSLYLVK